MRPTCATVVFLLLLLSPGPSSPQENPERLPATESATVLVDVVVRDKRGLPVTGLGVADFAVLEDGVAQKVTQFSLAGAAGAARAETQPSAAGPRTASPGGSPPSPGSAPAPTIAFVFDRLSTEGRVAAQKAVLAFAEKKGLGAWAGVFSLEDTLLVVQDFTPDPARVLAAVSALGTRVSQAGTSVADRNRTRTNARIQANAAEARLTRMGTPGSNEEGAALAQATVVAMRASLAAAAEDAFDRLDRDQHGFVAANALAAIVDALRTAPGRKAIVLFSDGLFRTEANQDRFLSVVNAANRASVSVYAVEAHGLDAQSPEALAHQEIDSSADVRTAQQESGRDTGGGAFARNLERMETLVRYNPRASLEWLSESTGGFFVSDTNDFEGPLGRIGSDLESYYLLGYTPSNQTYDGRFRKITVKVKGSGLSVGARSGYFAVRTVGPVLTHVAPVLAMLESGKKPHAFEVYAGAWPFPEAEGAARVPLVVSVPGRALSTLPSKKKDGGVDLTLLARVLDAKGVAVEAVSRRFSLDAAGVRQSRDADLRLLRDTWLPPGRYTLEAAAYEAGSQKASVVTTPLEVLDGSSSMDRVQVVVVRQALPAGSAGIEVESGHPFRFGDVILQPLAGEPFPRQASNRLVVQVTASPAAGTRPPSAVMGLWQGDRKLEERVVAWERPEPSGLVRHVGELPIATLGPGLYEVQVELSEGGRERRLRVPFTIQ